MSRASVTAEIERLAAAVPGWTPPDQLLALYFLALATAPLGGDVLEIGSWCGRSTAVLGHAARDSGVGHVWAVDLFPRRDEWRLNPDGSHSIDVRFEDGSVGAYKDQSVWPEPFQRDIAPLYDRADGIMEIFNATIAQEELSDFVTPFRGDARRFTDVHHGLTPVRLAFIDADHDYDAVCRDIEIVEHHLQPGGWIAFDDAFSNYVGVDRAIAERVIESPNYSCGRQISRKLFVARREGNSGGF